MVAFLFRLTLSSIAQARTGTGKTLGFLVPLIQRIIDTDHELASRSRLPRRPRASDIRAIIISPTRELAEQIAVEAKKLTADTNIRVHTAVGGSHKSLMLDRMRQHGCHLLVGTPGRLHDILSDPRSGVTAPGLSSFVLDEADRLLDIGFSQDIDDIVKLLPDPTIVDRQTMMFSATMSRDVLQLARRSLKSDFQFVQTVHEGEQPTHEKVPQRQVQLKGLENNMPTLLELCKREIDKTAQSGAHFKAIIYFNSTANVKLAANIFENLPGSSNSPYAKHPLWPVGIFEMHSKLTQRQRTRVSDQFRKAKTAIMFSSDVTARGMDFPKVTHVIQVGLPPNVEQYIHRLGRTGRGDQPGEGWLLLSDVEIREARRVLARLPIERDTSLAAAQVDMTQEAQLPVPLADILSQVGEATKKVDYETKSTAYSASIGVMQRFVSGRQIVECLNQWARFGWGMETPPSLSRSLIDKFGLENATRRGRSENPRGSGSYGGYGNGRRQNFRSDRGAGSSFSRDSNMGGRDFGNDRRGQYSSRGDGYGRDRGGSRYSNRGGRYGGDHRQYNSQQDLQ